MQCFKNANPVSSSTSSFERVNYLYLNAIIQKYNKLFIQLNPSLRQLLTGNPAKCVQLIIPFILLERRKKGTYTALCARLRGLCWYHYMLAFPVPGPASLAMQIGTCKPEVNKKSYTKHQGKRGKYFNANSIFGYMLLSLFEIYRSDQNFGRLEAKQNIADTVLQPLESYSLQN